VSSLELPSFIAILILMAAILAGEIICKRKQVKRKSRAAYLIKI